MEVHSGSKQYDKHGNVRSKHIRPEQILGGHRVLAQGPVVNKTPEQGEEADNDGKNRAQAVPGESNTSPGEATSQKYKATGYGEDADIVEFLDLLPATFVEVPSWPGNRPI